MIRDTSPDHLAVFHPYHSGRLHLLKRLPGFHPLMLAGVAAPVVRGSKGQESKPQPCPLSDFASTSPLTHFKAL